VWRNCVTIFHWILVMSAAVAIAVWVLFNGSLRWFLLSGLCSVSGLAIGLGVSFPGLRMFGRSLCAFDTMRKAVALTFDDGPDPVTTPAVLKVLAEHNAHATFFCVGVKVRQHADLVRRIMSEGHQVENHSYAHSHWTNLFPAHRLIADLEQAQMAIAALTGRKPTLFRPPMGLTNLRVFKAAKFLDLQVTGYTARAFDRRPDSPEEIGERLIRKLRPGAILLLHDGGVPVERATAVLKHVLEGLRRHGFQCSTMDSFRFCGPAPYSEKPLATAPANPD
jgi:peptidoglycan/xylan/chitin deacetylase (PgdA/CDA1 family)